MKTPLERIEEKHSEIYWDGMNRCRECNPSAEVAQDKLPAPCDVVLLARALDEAISVMERVQAQSVKSRRWTTSMAWDGAIVGGRRTLAEVAGEEKE